MCGGRRSLCTQDNNVYVPAVPHTGYARRGYSVIIQLGRHRQGVSPLWMWNSARLRWTLSPLRNVSFDSKSCTVEPILVLRMSWACTPSRAPSKTPTIVPIMGFFLRMSLLDLSDAPRVCTSPFLSVWQDTCMILVLRGRS